MKNKIILLLLAIIFFIPIDKIYGDELKFEAKEIIIKEDGNYIEAKNETKIEASKQSMYNCNVANIMYCVS